MDDGGDWRRCRHRRSSTLQGEGAWTSPARIGRRDVRGSPFPRVRSEPLGMTGPCPRRAPEARTIYGSCHITQTSTTRFGVASDPPLWRWPPPEGRASPIREGSPAPLAIHRAPGSSKAPRAAFPCCGGVRRRPSARGGFEHGAQGERVPGASFSRSRRGGGIAVRATTARC